MGNLANGWLLDQIDGLSLSRQFYGERPRFNEGEIAANMRSIERNEHEAALAAELKFSVLKGLANDQEKGLSRMFGGMAFDQNGIGTLEVVVGPNGDKHLMLIPGKELAHLREATSVEVVRTGAESVGLSIKL